jgi:hypothetical protein
MTRLERVVDLLNKYDNFAEACVKSFCLTPMVDIIKELREEKEKLTKELIEHGCRRRN